MVDYIVDHPTNTFTMVVLFAATVAWLWRIIHPYPWKPIRGRGTVKALWQGFIYADQPRNKLISNQLVNIDRDKGQISKLCAAVNKKPPQKHPDIIRCLSVEWFTQVKQNLT